ncbi:hypothetical protein E4U52_006055 [Claviceps spartinae]|nr:hypothetical protein E4U52_006055 [Claviceps spartinae]
MALAPMEKQEQHLGERETQVTVTALRSQTTTACPAVLRALCSIKHPEKRKHMTTAGQDEKAKRPPTKDPPVIIKPPHNNLCRTPTTEQ